MDFLQIFLIILIIFITTFLGVGGWMVFLILKDLRSDIKKLDQILSSDSAIVEKLKKDVKKTNITPEKSGKIFSQPRRFFKKVL